MATNTRSRVLVSIAIGTLSLGLTAPAAMAHPGKAAPHSGDHAQHAQHGPKATKAAKAKRYAWGHAALRASRVVVSESAGTATVTLRLNKKAPAAASFTWSTVDDRPARRGRATVGQDYVASSGTVTIAAGSRSATVTVPILDDTTAEKKTESFVVRFKPTTATTAAATKAAKREGLRKGWCAGSHGRPTATVVIVDND